MCNNIRHVKEETNFSNYLLVKFRSIFIYFRRNYVTCDVILDTVSKFFVSFLNGKTRDNVFKRSSWREKKEKRKRNKNDPILITKMINVYTCEFITTRKQCSN